MLDMRTQLTTLMMYFALACHLLCQKIPQFQNCWIMTQEKVFSNFWTTFCTTITPDYCQHGLKRGKTSSNTNRLNRNSFGSLGPKHVSVSVLLAILLFSIERKDHVMITPTLILEPWFGGTYCSKEIVWGERTAFFLPKASPLMVRIKTVFNCINGCLNNMHCLVDAVNVYGSHQNIFESFHYPI